IPADKVSHRLVKGIAELFAVERPTNGIVLGLGQLRWDINGQVQLLHEDVFGHGFSLLSCALPKDAYVAGTVSCPTIRRSHRPACTPSVATNAPNPLTAADSQGPA